MLSGVLRECNETPTSSLWKGMIPYQVEEGSRGRVKIPIPLCAIGALGVISELQRLDAMESTLHREVFGVEVSRYLSS